VADGAVESTTTPREAAAVKKEQTRPERSAKKLAAKAGAEAHKDSKAQSASDATPDANAGGDVKMSGMSVLGNDDSPKSLVIVPWKSSQLGDMPGLSKMLDDSTQPVDKEVFMRELSYYQIKADSNR
jgi:hypothetical protein